MFVEHKEQGEPSRESKTLKLSEAIRIGLPLVRRESQTSFRLCALGCAWAGLNGREMTDGDMNAILKKYGGTREVMRLERHLGTEMGFSPVLTKKVHDQHCQGKSASWIADWLEAQGF